MSQLLSRLSKLSYRNKTVLKHKNSRLISTSSPYLIVGVFAEDARARGGGFLGKILLFDPAKEELLTVRDKTVSEELVCSKVMGASHGWGFFSDLRDHNSVCITDFFNPLASKSDSKIITLPPLTSMIYGQTQVVWNVAMSSSSPYHHQDNDCVVAIKFLGKQLSMCRPGRSDLGWTNKPIPFPSFENSNLMYSKREQRFSLPVPGGNYLCSWDLHFENEPKFTELVFRNLPKLPQSEWELIDSCFREDHWVESPSGQSFLVKWYSHVPSIRCKEPMVMVFRDDQDTNEGTEKNMSYTEDIGDLCIFLSKSEPFCVVASSCPGLKPNSIYMMGRCFAVYDITTKTARHFERPIGVPESLTNFLPYWLPPFSM